MLGWAGHIRGNRLTDGRGGFVQDEKLASTHDGTSKRDDLTLANGEVTTPTRNGGIKGDPAFADLVLKRE
jgi:hypothetical protein